MDTVIKKNYIYDALVEFDGITPEKMAEWGEYWRSNSVPINAAMDFAAQKKYNYNRTLQLCLFVLLRLQDENNRKRAMKVIEKEQREEKKGS